jgi:hypothetical protein
VAMWRPTKRLTAIDLRLNAVGKSRGKRELDVGEASDEEDGSDFNLGAVSTTSCLESTALPSRSFAGEEDDVPCACPGESGESPLRRVTARSTVSFEFGLGFDGVSLGKG